MAKSEVLEVWNEQGELEGAVAYLETILRAAVERGEMAALSSRDSRHPAGGSRLISAARRFIETTGALRRFIDVLALSSEGKENEAGEEELDPRIVLALAKADLARKHALFRSRDSTPRSDGWKGEGILSIVLTVGCGIIVAAATSLFNANAEIEARRAEEVYSGRRQFLQETISRLTDAQADAQNLSLGLRQAETSGNLHLEDIGFYRESIDNLRKKIRRVMAVLQAPPKSELRFAQLRAFYEIEALDVCLRSAQGAGGDIGIFKDWIEGNRGSDLSGEQVEQILTEAMANAPCGGSFEPEVIDDLIQDVAKELWTLASEIKK